MVDTTLKLINGKYYSFDPRINESFVRTAQELKMAGVKNYYFMLEVKNPRVLGIDPFKPNITKSEIQLLLQEYHDNMWYFIRTAVRMRTNKGVVPYCLHRGLAAVGWNFLRHQDNCLCEPRQTYKTTGTLAGPIQWAFQLSHDVTMHFFGKETKNTEKNLADLKNNIEVLPKWLQFKIYLSDEGKVKKSTQNVKKMENGVARNKIYTWPKANSAMMAESLGRGGSGSVLYFDELEHTLYINEIISNSSPLYKTARDNALASGSVACRLASCTPGNLDNKIGKDSYPIIKSMIPWTERMYDMTDEEIETYKKAFIDDYRESNKNSGRDVMDMIYIEYQYFQLRKDYNWVMDQFKLSGDKNEVRREILLQRIRGTTASPISAENINYLVSNMRKSTKDLLIDGKWLLKIYDHEDAGKVSFATFTELNPEIPYLVGVDPAGGDSLKGDNFAITIVNPYNLKIAAEFKSPYLTGPNAARLLTHLVDDYIPRAVLCIERNSVGQYLIQHLAETHIKNNLYWNQAKNELEDITEISPEDNMLRQASLETQKYGQFVGRKVREAMFEKLFEMIEDHIDLLTTEYLVNDICSLVRYPTGKIAAEAGEHDDNVMSYNHALYVYFVGDNLPFFGIFKEDHPIANSTVQRETGLDETPMNKILLGNTPEEERIDFDKYTMECAAYQEEFLQEMVERLPYYADEKATITSRNISNGMDNTVHIGAWFFDSINS